MHVHVHCSKSYNMHVHVAKVLTWILYKYWPLWVSPYLVVARSALCLSLSSLISRVANLSASPLVPTLDG